MTEDLLDGFWVKVSFERDRCKAVAELMGGSGYAGSFPIMIVKGDKAAIGERFFAVVTYNIFVGLTYMLYQLVTQRQEERDNSVACLGLRSLYDRSITIVGDGFGNVNIIPVEINIFPSEGEYLTFSHTRHEGKEWEEPKIGVILNNLLIRAACRLTRRFWQVCGGLNGSAGIHINITFHDGIVEYSVNHHTVIAYDFQRIALGGEIVEIFLNIFGDDILCGSIIEKSNSAAHRKLIRTNRLESKLRLCFFPPFIGDFAEASADLSFLCVKYYFFIDLALGLAVKIYALVCTWVYDGFTEATVGASR